MRHLRKNHWNVWAYRYSRDFYHVLLSDYVDGRGGEKDIMSRDFSYSYRGSYLFIFAVKSIRLWSLKNGRKKTTQVCRSNQGLG